MKNKLLSIITVTLLLLLFISPTVALGQVPAVEQNNDAQLIEIHAAILLNYSMAKRFMIDKDRNFESFKDRLQIKVNSEQEAVENVLKQIVVFCSRGSPG